MDIWIQKSLKYAVYSNVAIQLGKNVRVIGDVASTYTGTNKGPPVQMFSDFHYLPNLPADGHRSGHPARPAQHLRHLLHEPAEPFQSRRRRRRDSRRTQGPQRRRLHRRLRHRPEKSRRQQGRRHFPGRVHQPHTGKLYDTDLFTLIDSPEGRHQSRHRQPAQRPAALVERLRRRRHQQSGWIRQGQR